jgi:hypothetical protein
LDHDGLARLLSMPDSNLPKRLFDGLCFVQEAARSERFEELYRYAQQAGIILPDDRAIEPADLALRVWLESPETLRRFEASQHPDRVERTVSPSARPAARYTLLPLLEHGRDALTCADIEGIDAVRLVELHVGHDGGLGHRETHRAADVFEALADIDRPIPEDARPVRATFMVRFSDSRRWRSVTVCVPHVVWCEWKSDREIVHLWLRQRGFLQEALDETLHREPAGVLAVC